MSKKAIWGIIGLMSVALLGSIALQAYWINERLRLEEGQFDKTVFDVLVNISEKLKIEEKKQREQSVWNPNGLSGSTLMETPFTNESGVGLGFFSKKHNFDTINNSEHINTLECTCIDCRKEKFEAYMKKTDRWMTKQLYSPDPIEQRIKVDLLDRILHNELINRNIHLDYTYGVYSSPKKAFVIKDGKFNYVPSDEDESVAASTPDIEVPKVDTNLLNSKYSVQLFQNSTKIQPPGYLMIHFPGKVGYVWGTVWTTVLAAILFTAVILFCFVYTIQIIFTQKKLSEIKTDFINNMTHEFKTPIATISLASDSITSPMIAGNAEKVQRFANIIKQENQRMNSQVEKVLQMALLDKRNFSLKLTQVDANEVVSQAINNIGLRVEKLGGKAEAVLLATNSFVEADLTHFSNVINNLLDNAYKYSPDNPQITVTTKNVANGISISIKDNGIGMNKEDRKRIFDKFYRVHTGDIHDVKGFGLGLSYVKAILTAHKGTINVKSELGKGSEFILFFPFSV